MVFVYSFIIDGYSKVVGVSGMNLWNSSPLCEMNKDGLNITGCSAADIGANMDIPVRFFTKEADR